MRSIAIAFVVLGLVWPALGQTQVTRYLIVGDSWAEEQMAGRVTLGSSPTMACRRSVFPVS